MSEPPKERPPELLAMSRYKGRVSARALERDFPHVVETVVPKGGLGKTLVAMHEFHKLHGIDAHTGKGRPYKFIHKNLQYFVDLAHRLHLALADMAACPRDVRVTPESGHLPRRLRCPLSANSGHCAAAHFQTRR
jgi:hypothetical protein